MSTDTITITSAGRHVAVPRKQAVLKAPRQPLAAPRFVPEARAGLTHLVDTRDGQSWGIMATDKIAAEQASAMGRISA